MKAIHFAIHLLTTCRAKATSLLENTVLLAIAAELDNPYTIANKTGFTASNTATCLHRLAKAGHIESYDWIDGSIPCYRLTQKGATHLLDFFPSPTNKR